MRITARVDGIPLQCQCFYLSTVREPYASNNSGEADSPAILLQMLCSCGESPTPPHIPAIGRNSFGFASVASAKDAARCAS